MEDTKPLPKNRVTLDYTAKEKIDGWREQLFQKFPGIQISDSELVNWFILKQSPTITSKQLFEIKESFFDEVRELQWKLAQAKAAKEKSENSALDVPV